MGFFDSFQKPQKKSDKNDSSFLTPSSSTEVPLPPPPPKHSAASPSPPVAAIKTPQSIELNKPIDIGPPRDDSLFQSSPVDFDHNPVLQTTDQGSKFPSPESTLSSNIPPLSAPPAPDETERDPSAVPDSLPGLPGSEELMTNAPKKDIPFFPDVSVSSPLLNKIPVLDAEEDYSFYKKYQNIRKPLFVRTDSYSQILKNIDIMKTHVLESNEIIYSLENLKRNSDIEHKNYKKTMEDIQRKLIYVDKIIFNS